MDQWTGWSMFYWTENELYHDIYRYREFLAILAIFQSHNWHHSKVFGAKNWQKGSSGFHPLRDVLLRFITETTIRKTTKEKWTLRRSSMFAISSRWEGDPWTVWSLETASSRPWRAALGRNVPAPASMRRRAPKRRTWGRCRDSSVRRASTQWWPSLWCRRRSNRPSRASSTSLRTWGAATRPKRWVARNFHVVSTQRHTHTKVFGLCWKLNINQTL